MDQLTNRLEGITHHPYAFSMVCFLIYFIAGLLILQLLYLLCIAMFHLLRNS